MISRIRKFWKSRDRLNKAVHAVVWVSCLWMLEHVVSPHVSCGLKSPVPCVPAFAVETKKNDHGLFPTAHIYATTVCSREHRLYLLSQVRPQCCATTAAASSSTYHHHHQSRMQHVSYTLPITCDSTQFRELSQTEVKVDLETLVLC